MSLTVLDRRQFGLTLGAGLVAAASAAKAGAARPFDKVRFESAGVPLVGDLYAPDAPEPASGGRRPAVAIIGPMTYQKEQAPTQYAGRLAAAGFVALAFDCRYRGESGGQPRAWENPAHKVQDLQAAVAYLASRPDVDPDRVFILGICQGSSAALAAAAADPRVAGLATIAGHYRDPEADVAWLTEEGRRARLNAGLAARAKYEATGQVDYIPGVSQTDMNVGMPGDFVWVWYQPWADRGLWDNRYAVMSDADLLTFESLSSARSLTRPWLMIHGENCFLPAAARRHYDAVPAATRKALVWDDTPHLSYYDQPADLDRAAARVADWFASV
jgi:fermentation-respiration switch protein FrsA (DUF1100 family)